MPHTAIFGQRGSPKGGVGVGLRMDDPNCILEKFYQAVPHANPTQ
jgi:hypothetical protein